MSDDFSVKAYEEAGKYVVRELTLINNRLTWILTIHGFLYATYGLTIQKQLDIFNIINGDKQKYPLCVSLTQSEYFLFTIAFVGIAISSLGLVSISAAGQAMENIADSFIKANSRCFVTQNIDGLDFYKLVKTDYSFPHLLGGGKGIVNGRGNSAAMWIPVALLLSWCFALYTSVTIHSNHESVFCSISHKT